MANVLSLLLVEDCEDDAELVLAELRRAGIESVPRRVMSESELREALAQGSFHAILSDHSLPAFDAHGVLRVVKELGLDVPVLVVSGSLEEEAAVSLLRSGAQDFLLKDRLARLAPALLREVREAARRAEQRKMREQLLMNDRMASIGLLAAGVAHEINNPLGVLLGTLELMSSMLAQPERYGVSEGGALAGAPHFSAFLADASEAAERIRNIARDITTFSRSDESAEPSVVQLSSVLESSLRMAHPQIRHRAHVVKDIEPLLPVLANEGRIGQLFLNLLLNAAQAIPEGDFDRHEIRISGRMREGTKYAEITISDTGSGILPEHLARIFEPFFTTKPVGVGTGLGLPICKRIMTELGGELTVTSQVGRGSAFTARFPTTSHAQNILKHTHSARRGGFLRGKVLVLDDERMIVTLVQNMLKDEHEVHATTSPEEALSLIEREPFDVVLCDVMMPNTNGLEFFRAAVRAVPEMVSRFVFMTGAASSDSLRDALSQRGNPILDKPFDAERLREVIRDAVRRRDRFTPVLHESALSERVMPSVRN
jgi:signal transduction histidine kinase/AmiR/NasT family two-component response regulator